MAHGFRHVEFHGWGVGGHDNFYPEYDPDPAMGGRDALMKGIKRLQARGLHVSVHSNGQLQQQGGTKWYDEKGCILQDRGLLLYTTHVPFQRKGRKSCFSRKLMVEALEAVAK